jgi:hypothetical protein
MAHAVLSVPSFLGPLQALWQFAARLSAGRPARPETRSPLRAPQAERRQVRPARPLRVVRVLEAHSRGGAGRMVISGRMAEVCAELERLAAREAQELQR